MWGTLIATIAGAVIGGTVNGVTAYKNNKTKVAEYTKSAEDIREATEKYSGQNAYNTITEKGIGEGADIAQAAIGEAARVESTPTNPGVTGAGPVAAAADNAERAAANASGAYKAGQSLGQQNASSRMNALYNRETTKAQQAMKQADINYNVANQTAQEVMNTAGNAIGTVNQLRRTNGRNITD